MLSVKYGYSDAIIRARLSSEVKKKRETNKHKETPGSTTDGELASTCGVRCVVVLHVALIWDSYVKVVCLVLASAASHMCCSDRWLTRFRVCEVKGLIVVRAEADISFVAVVSRKTIVGTSFVSFKSHLGDAFNETFVEGSAGLGTQLPISHNYGVCR